MLPHVNKIIFFSFLFITTVFSQAIQTFEISGNSLFPDNQYRQWAGVSTGVRIFPGIMDSIKNKIAHQLSRNGYFDFKFT